MFSLAPGATCNGQAFFVVAKLEADAGARLLPLLFVELKLLLVPVLRSDFNFDADFPDVVEESAARSWPELFSDFFTVFTFVFADEATELGLATWGEIDEVYFLSLAFGAVATA